jgi:hypothetical protein
MGHKMSGVSFVLRIKYHRAANRKVFILKYMYRGAALVKPEGLPGHILSPALKDIPINDTRPIKQDNSA